MTLKAETEDWLHTGKGKKNTNKKPLIGTSVSARGVAENTTQQGFQSNGRKNAHQSQGKNKNKEKFNKQQE